MGHSIDAQQKAMLSKLESVSIVAAAKSEEVMAEEITKNKPSTYAGAVSSNLSNIVKSAVASSIKEQRRVGRSKASIVIYDVVEDRNDSVDTRKILSVINCDLQIVGCVRLRSPCPASKTSSHKPRPLKVELSTIADRVLVLNAANRQRYKFQPLEINVSPLLQADELNKLKKLRLRFQELNEAAHKANGKRPFVVVSNRLKVRRVSGELADYTDKCGAHLDTLSKNVSTSTSRKVASEKSNKLLVEKSSNSCSKDADGVIIVSACEQVEIVRRHALLNQQRSSFDRSYCC